MNFTKALGMIGVVALTLVGARAANEPKAPLRESPFVLTADEQRTAEAFEARVKEYRALCRKLQGTLPGVPKRATPEEISQNQLAFCLLLRTARESSVQGEFFTPALQALVKRTLAAVFAGPDGPNMRASIMDENPGVPTLRVNDRYPDTVPLSTMPPQILKALPKLEEELEYRFIGERLALMDSHAHVIVDFTDDVLP